MAKIFRPIGMYGDGTLGHQHTRERCAAMLEMYQGSASLAHELRGEMSDDASEEQDACDWLNDHVGRDDASWGWRDGDFGLWRDDEEE